MRILFLGMLGKFSLPPLQAVLEAGLSVVGVVVPADNSAIPIRELKPVTAVSPLQLTPTQPTIVHQAWKQKIPIYEVNRLAAPETQKILSDLHPDVACVACFNKRIPANLLTLPQHGFLNLHPSLLPKFRGPAPLFWTFRAGIQETGVTLHLMDTGLDTGNIVQQAPFTLTDGISGQEADVATATLGGQLLVKALNQLANDTFTSIPQPTGGSNYPWPKPANFRVPVSWSARHAFNFMRGTTEFGQPFTIEMEEGEIMVKTAVSFSQDTTLNQPYQTDRDKIQIQFTDGVVTAVFYEPSMNPRD